MKLLVDELPTAVEIGGKEYAINVDFRACIRTILAFEDPDLTGQEKQMVMLQNLFPVMPDDPGGAIEQALKFLNGGQLNEVPDESPLRLYSFAKDAGYIFAAFRQTHGINLETDNMHWFSFMALFSDLGSDTSFCNLINLRKKVKTGKATAEERQAAEEMGDAFLIEEPDLHSAEETEISDTFDRLYQEGRKKHGK